MTPSNETIADQSYPLCNEFYAAILQDSAADSPERRIYEWPVSYTHLDVYKRQADHDTGGLVDQTDSGRGLVDVLAAGTGGAEHLHLDILGADVHLNGVVQLLSLIHI